MTTATEKLILSTGRYIIRGKSAIYGGSRAPVGRSKKWDHSGVFDRFIVEVHRTHGFKIIDGKEYHMKVWLEWTYV